LVLALFHLSALVLSAVGIDPTVELNAGLERRTAGPERAAWASRLLVGTRYQLSPLGDREGPAAGPRFRLDAFDCVTFVETVIALGNSANTSQAGRLLDDIRYDGPPDYTHRNHYIEAQWIPANLRKGWISEGTRAIAGPLARPAKKQLTPATWRAAERFGYVLPDLPKDQRPLGVFTLDIVPLGRLSEIGPRIPEGTLLFVLRSDRPGRPYRVTHAGVVVAGSRGERYLRHASDVPGVLRVRDEPLDQFAARNARYHAWPVSGVSLFAIRDNAERARKLAEAASADGKSASP
jgi:hypothetical protein